MFPYENEPDAPGPLRHAAIVIAAFNRRNAGPITSAPVPVQGLVVVVFTSSQIWKFGDRLPVGVVPVRGDNALRQGGQKPFFIDVRKRAFLPLVSRFFPDIDTLKQGLIGPATRDLMDEVIRQYQLVNDRHREQVVNLGPLRPRGL